MNVRKSNKRIDKIDGNILSLFCVKKIKNMDGFDLRFKLPSNLLAVGPTSCGKTSWLKKLVEDRAVMCSPVPECMILFYKEFQPTYADMERG